MTAPPKREPREPRPKRPSPRISMQRNVQITLRIVARKRRKFSEGRHKSSHYGECYSCFDEAVLVYRQLLAQGEKALLGCNMISATNPFQVAVALGSDPPQLGAHFRSLTLISGRLMTNDGSLPAYDGHQTLPHQ